MMEQLAKVISVDEASGTAVVSVSRKTMCDGCSKADCDGSCTMGNMFGSSGEMKATAINEAGAGEGDTVELESPTKSVLSAAALVFIFPIIAAFAAYLIAYFAGAGEGISLLSALGGFAAAFIVIGLYERSCGKKKIRVRITKIIKSKESACGEE